jgi:rRNA maturation protein Nop10
MRGCDLCGDWPVVFSSACHPTAPLRVEMTQAGELILYCYLPKCNRVVARLRLALTSEDEMNRSCRTKPVETEPCPRCGGAGTLPTPQHFEAWRVKLCAECGGTGRVEKPMEAANHDGANAATRTDAA